VRAALFSFVVALLTAWLLTPAVRAFARRIQMVARPGADRWHQQPTAMLGGMAIFAGFLAGIAALVVLRGGNPLAAMPSSGVGTLAAATLLFVTGLIDDRFQLRPSSKLVLQVVGAVVVVSAGIIYPVTPWLVVNVLLTIFWFLALTNALNLLDNMDGVTAGVAAVAGLFLGISFATNGELGLAAVCAALSGAALGFLPYNFHRATIFMGDSGSLFVGAVLASLGAAYPSSAAHGIVPVLFVPAFIVIVPILDTVLVTTTRTLAGRSVARGGRDHATHRMVALGLSERQTAVLLYAFACLGGLFGLAIAVEHQGFGVLGVLFLVLLALGAAYLGRLKVYSGDAPASGRATILVSNLLFKKRALEVLLDIVLFGTAYYAAHLLRWDARLPPTQLDFFERSVGVSIAAYAIAFALVGVYRGEWQRLSVSDAHRIARATALGWLLANAAMVILFRNDEFARSILLLDALLVLIFTSAARFAFRSLDLLRRAHRTDGERTLIYGAGARGEIVARELLANRRLGLLPVGFLDDDANKTGRVIHGLPVLGGIDQLLGIIQQQRVQRILLAAREFDSVRRRQLASICLGERLALATFSFEMQTIELAFDRSYPQLLWPSNNALARQGQN
jgi:UDP-GlcNAc:undecaprenyl-phosphate GlcNAc-1-phosphate transferase